MTIIGIASIVALLIFGAVFAAVALAVGLTVLVPVVGRLADWFDKALFGGE
jgi:hypothetical protein